MALREILARFGFQIEDRGLKKAETGIAGVVGQMRTFGALIAGSAIVRGMANFVGDLVTAGDQLGKTAKQLGLSTTQLQQWDVAARLSGASTQELNVGIRTLAKNALLAEQGSKQAAEAYESLGVEVTDASGNLKDSNTLFRETGLALGQLKNNTERTALAQQLLGRSGVKLIPLFEKGEAALDDLLSKLEEYGGGIGPEAVALSEQAADEFLFFELATDSLKSKLAVAFLPILNQAVGGLSKLISWVSKNTEVVKSFAVSLGLLTIGRLSFAAIGAAIKKFGGSLLRMGRALLLPLAKFALMFLIVDDLIALFEGRGSVIGTFIDKIFGPGSAKAIVDGVKGIGKAVADVVKTGDFEAFDKALDEIFGPIGHDIVADVVFTFEMIGEAIDEGVAEAKAAINQWLDESKASLSDGADDFLQAAKDIANGIIDGIVEGIEGGVLSVTEALGGVLDAAVKAVKDKFKIKSPSGVTEDEIGGPLAMGVPAGAKKMARRAARMTATALQVVTATASPSVATAAPRALSAPGTGQGSPQVIFKSEINIEVKGGSASDPQISKLRQGVRSELRENRRATLDALTQRVEVT